MSRRSCRRQSCALAQALQGLVQRPRRPHQGQAASRRAIRTAYLAAVSGSRHGRTQDRGSGRREGLRLRQMAWPEPRHYGVAIGGKPHRIARPHRGKHGGRPLYRLWQPLLTDSSGRDKSAWAKQSCAEQQFDARPRAPLVVRVIQTEDRGA